MSASWKPLLSLKRPVTPEALVALRSAAAAACSAGAERVVIDIDDVGVLDSHLIAALITLLREVREHGGDVTLLAEHKSILDTLRITALDKVFTVEAPRAPLPAELAPTRVRGPHRRLAALAIAVIALASLGGRPV